MDNNKIVCKVKNCEYHTRGDLAQLPKLRWVAVQKCCSSCDTECITFKPCE